MNAPSEIEGSDLPDSICSRVVATPSGKTEPMIFSVKGSPRSIKFADSHITLITSIKICLFQAAMRKEKNALEYIATLSENYANLMQNEDIVE
nr:hypothetical protein HmN_000935300 [Hymenolepis microstoma]